MSARILVVDDNDAIREALVAVLRKAGYEPIACDGAQAALARADGTVRLAILDVWMPDTDGLALLKRLKQAHPALPVIMISGGGPGQTLEGATLRADLHGATAFLYKPFSNAELLAAVATALEG